MKLSSLNRSVTMLARLIDPTRPTRGYLPPTADKPVFTETYTPYFPRTSPEDVGVSSHAVKSFLQAISDHPDLHMHTLTLLRDGKIFCEKSFGAQDVHIPKYTFSACKSIVSLCIGILVGDGVLSLDEKITDIFSERTSPMSRLTLGALCVKDLLTMRTGITFNEFESQTESDWIKGYLNSAVQGKIGTAFSYNSLNTYMLTAIICKKTGMSLSAFANERLFAPLSITDYFWETCPRGIEKGGWGLYMRAEDLAKLGYLVLRGGKWSDALRDGQMLNDTHKNVCIDTQIIPESYIRDAVSPHAVTDASYGAFNYGYQIWVSRDEASPTYLFNGLFGQNVMMFRKTDIVLVTNAGNHEFFQTSPFYAIALDAFSKKEACLVPKKKSDDAPKEIPVQPTAKRSLFDTVIAILGINKTKKEAQVSPPQIRIPPITLPHAAERFLDRTFVSVPAYTQSNDAETPPQEEPNPPTNPTGLMPVLLQAVQNAYTSGFVSISLAKATDNGNEHLLVTYKEKDETHTFAAGTVGAMRTTCTFCGIPFRVAASCRFTTDENERDVLVLQIDFIETPFSRTVKLILNPSPHAKTLPDAVLVQEESPGADMVLRVILDAKDSLSEGPILGAALGKIDNLYLDYRVRRKFAPELSLRVQKSDEENKIN